MFGIGPMLPLVPAAEKADRLSRKVQKRKSKPDPVAEGHELTIMRRPSTIRSESTLCENNDDGAVHDLNATAHHQRDLSLIIDFDLDHAATQLRHGEISDLELALFAFWIRANYGNYLMAKDLVRELALDQGYNVDKIANPRVRKLLQEVHDIRPRDPRHAPTQEIPFHKQTRAAGMSRSDSTRAVSKSLTARIDTLPPSLRLKRELAVQEAARSTMTSKNDADYPPNTPDRPAPLSVKSRGSQISDSTPMPSSKLRSVSTPIRSQLKGDLDPLLRSDPAVKSEASNAVDTSPFNAAKNASGSMSDVFCTPQSTNQSHCNLFSDRLQSSRDRRYGTRGRYMNQDSGDHALGPYQLDASDIASDSSYETFTSLLRKERSRDSTRTSPNEGMFRNESFDALESYFGSEDEYERSILESTSTISKEETKTQYQYAAQAPISRLVVAGPVPQSSERRAAAQARQKPQVPGLSSQAVSFHRPLPLRSYESEATMFPTVKAQAYSCHDRSKSVSSVVASTRPATKAMAIPYLTDPTQARNSLDEIERVFFERKNSHTKISEQVEREVASVPQRSSKVSTLAAFPIPPMDNPVGELPMLVSRAVSSQSLLRTTAPQHPVAFASLEDTYRAIVKVAMGGVLRRTRIRGEGLRAVDWDKLTSFERAWREMNRVLLETIYGRNDVILDETDIAYIDRISSQLRNEMDVTESTDWVRHVFEADTLLTQQR